MQEFCDRVRFINKSQNKKSQKKLITMKKTFATLALFIALYSNAQTIIPLYNGVAPGSENWTWSEREMKVDIGTIVFDVSKPSLTAFVPSNPNGTAVIIALGGAFHALAFDHEGTE